MIFSHNMPSLPEFENVKAIQSLVESQKRLLRKQKTMKVGRNWWNNSNAVHLQAKIFGMKSILTLPTGAKIPLTL